MSIKISRKAALVALGLLGLASTALLFYDWALPPTPTLAQALGQEEMLNRLHLYSGEGDPRLRAVDTVNAGGVAQRRFVTNRDGSREDIALKADGEHFASRRVYYPRNGAPDFAGGAEVAWHLQLSEAYAPDKDYVSETTSLRIDGSLQEHVVRAADGSKHLQDFGADGLTLTRDLVMIKQFPYSRDLTVQSDKRWREDSGHTLAYENVFDEKEGTHDITEWDAQHRLLSQTHWPKYDTVVGMTKKGYYPGTGVLRVSIEGSYSTTNAVYYRPDGTLDHVIDLSRGSVKVTYYDATGTKKRLEQIFFRQSADGNLERGAKISYKVYTIDEMDGDGNLSRSFRIWDGVLGAVVLHNVMINGVFVAYGEVEYTYDHDTHKLKTTRSWIGKADHKYDIEEEAKPEEALPPPAVPADELQPQVNLDEDDLPVPPPQSPH
jgi:hypothetical protein